MSELSVAFFPFLVAAGMAVGESIAGALFGPDVPRNNDVSGAGVTAAIMFYGSFLCGVVFTVGTMLVRKFVLHRSAADRVGLRSGMSVVGGFLIGLAVWIKPVPGVIGLLLFVAVPIALACPWPGNED